LQFLKGIVSGFSNISHKAAKHAKNNTLKSFITQYFGIPFLNLYGKVTITETYLVVLILFAIQVLFSKWWMSRHDQGPLEKIWKDLSYTSNKKIKTAAVSV